jgi:prevent-host-death family protein
VNRRSVADALQDIVIGDYHVTMSKDVGVAELKARLSEYLRAVRRGRELTVYDRDQPIARVVPYAGAEGRLQVREPLRRYRTLGAIPLPAPAPPGTDPVSVLLEDRRAR